MNQTDLLYRAFRGLTAEIEENHGVTALESNFAGAREPDKIVVIHNVCHVEEDWVAAIERGLAFIGKAIEEDRQFIRSNGEVQPIEKVKHVSRESVQHLSRHSDLISRKEEAEKGDLIPDKLYTVERLNDYTVYENRFLYLLLCRIRDFVGYRYDSLVRAYRLYRGELTSRKKMVTATRKFSYELTLTDEQDDVFAAKADPDSAYYLDRLEKIQQSVAFYLRTPLMVEVSRVDKIKSKITKTNVLRMDKNFKEAMALYEFLLAYDRDGFTVKREVKTLDPVGKEVGKELAVPALLTSFLVYEHGLGVEEALKEEFDREEARREEQKQLALAEAIRALKRRIAETGEGMEAYMLMLEERNAALEKDSVLLKQARAEIETLKETVENLKAEARVLRTEIEGLNDANAKLREEMERAEEEHRRKIEEMVREREEAETALKRAHAEELARAEEKRRADLAAAEERAKETVARVKEACEKTLEENRAKMAEQDAKRQEAEHTLTDVQTELKSVEHERDVYIARLTAVRSEYGLLTAADDFTTEAGFNALEHEFETLGRLVRREWTDVKKILKKEFSDSIRAVMRGKKGQKSEEYRKLSAEAQARRARAGTPAKNGTPAARQGHPPARPGSQPAARQGAQPAAGQGLPPTARQGAPSEKTAKTGAQPVPGTGAQPPQQADAQTGVKEQTQRNGKVIAGEGKKEDQTKR